MTLSPTKLPDKIRWSDVRKQRIRPDKIIWPVAPDGYIPNSVVRSFAPYPKFNRPTCANQGLHLIAQVKEDKWKKRFNYLLKKQFPPKEGQQNEEDLKDGLEHGIQSVPEETNIGESLKPFHSDVSVETKTEAKFALRRGVVLQQNAMQTNASSAEELQTNASSAEELQKNAPSLEELQTNASSAEELQTNASSAEELQMDATSVEELQTNASSVDELKSKVDGEKDFIHPPKEKSNASPTKQAKKGKKGQKASFKLSEDLSLSPRLQQEKDELQQEKDELQQEKDELQQEKDELQQEKDELQQEKYELQQEIASAIKEPKKSFQESRCLPGIGDSNQNRRRMTNFSLKKIKSFVPPFLPMRDRRAGSLLMYLYKRSKAEFSPSED